MIRYATELDKQELDLMLGNFNVKSSFKESYQHYLLNIKEETAGFLSYTQFHTSIEIEYIYIKDNYRKQGYAEELLTYLIENNDFEDITLEVKQTNQPAINLYGKLGFKIVATRDRYYNGENGYLMHRNR
jgi:[ribosomal protein S18]-alanine N-acetyltransferase